MGRNTESVREGTYVPPIALGGRGRVSTTEATEPRDGEGGMQHPLMQVVRGAGDRDSPAREAWAHIADGYRQALTVPGLCAGDRERFRRCLRRAEGLARLPSVRRAQ